MKKRPYMKFFWHIWIILMVSNVISFFVKGPAKVGFSTFALILVFIQMIMLTLDTFQFRREFKIKRIMWDEEMEAMKNGDFKKLDEIRAKYQS